MGANRRNPALRHRDFARLFAAQCVSVPGTYAAHVGLAVYAWEATGSATWVAAVTFGRFLPALLASPYAGVLAEHVERVRLLVVSDLLMALWQALIVVVVLADGPVLLVVVLAALNSVSGSAYRPAMAALVPQLVGERDLVAAGALTAALQSIVLVIGPAIGGLVAVLASPAWVFVGNGLSFLVSAVLVASIRVHSRPTDVLGEGPLAQLRTGARALFSGGGPLALTGLYALDSLLYGADTVLLVLISEQWLGTGAVGYSYLLAGLGIGGVFAAATARRASGRSTVTAVVVAASMLSTLPSIVLLVVPHPLVAFGVELVRGAGAVVVEVLAVVCLQRTLAPRLISRAFGMFFAVGMLAKSLGALGAAPLVDGLGLAGAVVVVSLVPAMLVLAAVPALRRVDRVSAEVQADLGPRVAVLRSTGLLAEAAPATLQRLAAGANEVELAPGEVLMSAGEAADALYVVLEGRLSVHGPAGEVLPEVRDGVVGEIGLLAGVPRTATVTAVEPSRLLRVDGHEFVDSLSVTPAAPTLLAGATDRMARTHPAHPGVPGSRGGRRQA
jgi:MFS family permease